MNDEERQQDSYARPAAVAATTDDASALLTIGAVADFLGASRDVVEKLIRSGAILAVDISPAFNRPKHRPAWRINKQALARFLAGRQTRPPMPMPTRRKKPSALVDFIR